MNADDVYPKPDLAAEAAERAKVPGNAHRRKLLNALLAAWDAHPDAQLGWVLDRAAILTEPQGLYRHIDSVPDADLLKGLHAMVCF